MKIVASAGTRTRNVLYSDFRVCWHAEVVAKLSFLPDFSFYNHNVLTAGTVKNQYPPCLPARCIRITGMMKNKHCPVHRYAEVQTLPFLTACRITISLPCLRGCRITLPCLPACWRTITVLSARQGPGLQSLYSLLVCRIIITFMSAGMTQTNKHCLFYLLAVLHITVTLASMLNYNHYYFVLFFCFFLPLTNVVVIFIHILDNIATHIHIWSIFVKTQRLLDLNTVLTT